MVEIEYEKQKINVPTSYDDVPLSLFETFYKNKPTEHRDRVAQIALICGVDADQLLKWPASAFSIIVGHVNFIFAEDNTQPSPIIEVDGVKYVIAIEDELSLGAWVDAEAIQKEGVAVLSNLLAIVCRPAGEEYDDKLNEARAAMFAALPASKVLGVLAFFLQCKTVLDARMQIFTTLREVGDRLPPNIKALLLRGGGIKLSQIWPIIKYYGLTLLLRYQLRRLLLSYSSANIKTKQIKPSEN